MRPQRLLACGLALLASACAEASKFPDQVIAPPPGQAAQLEAWVRGLCAIGPRSLADAKRLHKARHWVAKELAKASGQTPRVESVPLPEAYASAGPAVNLIVEWPGRVAKDEWIVVGAHYDTHPGVQGADDNASGLALLLALAGRLKAGDSAKSVRLVAFVNEEAPFFQSEGMGSWAHAKGCKARGEQVKAMLSLESLGHFSQAPNSQRYPADWLGWFYPTTGNFVGAIGNLDAWALTNRIRDGFRSRTDFPIEASALPEFIPGVGWSDQWAFWQEGYPAAMLTDTAVMRNPNYHQGGDRPETLDYPAMARVLEGAEGAVRSLATW